MRYLLDLHKKRDLKTDNQETNKCTKYLLIAQNEGLADLHKKRDLKTDNQETDGSENW